MQYTQTLSRDLLADGIWSNYVEVASSAILHGQWRLARTMFAAALNEAENISISIERQITSLHGLAYAELKSGCRADSALHLRKAFRLICMHPDGAYCDIYRLSRIACLLADSYLDQKSAARAMPVLKTAAEKIRRREGDESQALAPILKRMALIYSGGGRHIKAEQYMTRSLTVGQN